MNHPCPEVLCSVKLYCLYLHRYYHLIRQSDRYPLISFASYTAGLTSLRPSPLWLLILTWVSPFTRRGICWVHIPNSSSTMSVFASVWQARHPYSPPPVSHCGGTFTTLPSIRFHCDPQICSPPDWLGTFTSRLPMEESLPTIAGYHCSAD